ncbi:alpha-1,6-glucosidase domain-containing protein [Lysobacter sp. A3-1-A15]|uniref:alpha-1,6-glucosidase domain-containing protein n=1 Tax=Novilysobacter viscosus TaxID=3098602 RepID=UPI002ED93D9E
MPADPRLFRFATSTWLLAALLAAPPVHAGDAHAALADCDSDEVGRVLAPAAATDTAARGYWLDRHRIAWPGAPMHGNFVLHHSAHASVVATPGLPVRGSDARWPLVRDAAPLPEALRRRFAFIGDGPRLRLQLADDAIRTLLRGELVLTQEDERGRVVRSTRLQHPGALDDLYAAAAAGHAPPLGPLLGEHASSLRVWAPTAREVSVCLYDTVDGPATARLPLVRESATGAWTRHVDDDLSGRAYTYLVDVVVPGTGVVRNRVTDPYSVALTANSMRSVFFDLDADDLKPAGWDGHDRPAPLASMVDMAIYELHVRDFSRDDASVPATHRGTYTAFTQADSHGVRHLRALRQAGITDIHLLPVFDLATVPESVCIEPDVPAAAADSEAQQAAVMAVAADDCFNWGYDPYHFNAPEGSFATDATDPAVRIREFRAMVQSLHAHGLRVGMDVVYNHTTASGQSPRSVLDRVVPGYYHRLDANGAVERSTCCDNTATEHAMMARLMIDSAGLWVRHYGIDSFRFDLMGHQPREAMQRLQARVDAAAGRRVELIGEGWDFGEVAGGRRFVQASQGSLQGSGIATFSDRARDAIRGGGPADSGSALFVQGYANGLHYADNGRGTGATRSDLLHAADLVRAGLAGTLAGYRMVAADGTDTPLSGLDYKGQPAGYAAQPAEVVNYVENHDNQTLFDINVFKLPAGTSAAERARVQVLALALNAFSQGIAYFHAGGELLRSKSLDRNSFDSGDWFNRIDWTGRTNHVGTGLPPANTNEKDWDLMRPLMRDAAISPTPADIAFTRDAFLDLLRIRASSTLLRLRNAEDVARRLRFHNTGPDQNPVVIVGEIDGRGYEGANFQALLYLVNVSPDAQTVVIPALAGRDWSLHPVHREPGSADDRPYDTRYDIDSGQFDVAARTAVVLVID